jgi:hypothetical protein
MDIAKSSKLNRKGTMTIQANNIIPRKMRRLSLLCVAVVITEV